MILPLISQEDVAIFARADMGSAQYESKVEMFINGKWNIFLYLSHMLLD